MRQALVWEANLQGAAACVLRAQGERLSVHPFPQSRNLALQTVWPPQSPEPPQPQQRPQRLRQSPRVLLREDWRVWARC